MSLACAPAFPAILRECAISVHSGPMMSKIPSALPVALASVAMRVALIAAACVGARMSLSQHALLHDGWEYMRMSVAFASGEFDALTPETLRLFPGYPALMTSLCWGRHPEIAGLAVAVVCAALCGPLTARLGGDHRLAWWMVAFTPAWLLYTSTVMSEALSVMLTLLALIAIVDKRWVLAGAMVGFASVVRPVGALLFVPLVVEAWTHRRGRGVATVLATGLPLPLLHLLVSRLLWGDALRAIAAYAEKDFAWPLQSLVTDTLDPAFSLPVKILAWGTIALATAGGVGLWRQWRGDHAGARGLLIWHLVVGLFYLLLPSTWAFRCLDRFHLAIWPTTLIGLAPLLPRCPRRHAALLIALGFVAWVIALRWLVNLAAVFPFAERALPAVLP